MRSPRAFLAAVFVCAGVLTGCVRQGVETAVPANDVPSYRIQRAQGPIKVDASLGDAEWGRADEIELVFPWWDQSKGPKDKTRVKLLWDESHLYLGYVCKDPHISAYVTRRDGKTYTDDCVEVFVAPDSRAVGDYYGFEINAAGVVLDYANASGGQSDVAGDCEGMQVAVDIEGTLNDDSDRDTRWVVEVSIPFSSFPAGTPRSGDMWRLNLNRCGGETKPQFSQWSNSKTPAPNFHVPERFGEVFFAD